MKWKIRSIIAALAVAMIGCSHKQKTPIESAFEVYVNDTFVNPNDYKGLKSVELKDSMDFYNLMKETVELSRETEKRMDSLVKIFQHNLSHAPKNLVYSSKIQNKLHEYKYTYEANTVDIAIGRVSTDKLEKLVDSVRNLNHFNKSYILKAHIKPEAEYQTYYAHILPFSDSIIISKDPLQKEQMPDMMKESTKRIEMIMAGLTATGRVNTATEELNALLSTSGK